MNTLKERTGLDLNNLTENESRILGSVCRWWVDGSHKLKHLLSSRKFYLSKNLKKSIELINHSEKNEVESFEDFLAFLTLEDMEELSLQFADLELNSATHTMSWFLGLLKKNEAPIIGSALRGLSEDVSLGLEPVNKFLEVLADYKQPDEEAPVKVMTLEELTLQPKVQWLIEGVVPSNALACIYGPPGSGKSFLALDVALRVAHGGPWRNCETRQGRSLYIAGEGVSGLSDRVNSWLSYNDALSGEYTNRFSAIAKPVNVTSDFMELIKTVKEQKNTPDLIVIDTLARCFGPNDENSTSDMQKFILALDTIRLEIGCTVLVIHHSSKGEKVSLRGNSALEGCLDTVFKVEALERYDGKPQRIVAQVVKQKDAEGFQKYYYELMASEDSAVLKEISNSKVTGEKRGTEAGLFQALKDMIHSDDQWVSATQWRSAYSKMGPDFGGAVKRLVELGKVEYKTSGSTDMYKVADLEEI